MKFFNLRIFAKVALIWAMLCGSLAAYADNFCISVYKDGSSSQMFYFTLLSGDEYLCDNIVIDNYTGNPNDYKYWVGKDNNWQEGMSANFNLGSSNSSQGSVSGTDYISSCSTGAFSMKIYSGSGDKNWYPHNWTCETVPEPGSCDVQTKGASIPANTIIFYDNSDKLFSGEIWLSVPTESGNGNASNVNQGSYHRNKDKWYQMHKVDGDIWQATITTASSYGRMSFWNKDGHEADDVWQNTVVFQAPYTTGKNIYKPDASKKCTNSERQTDVYFKGSWSLRTGLFLNLSSTDRKIDDTNPITLKTEAIGVTGTNYTFEYRAFDADTWETLATQSSPEYILSGTKLPVKSTYYRVKYGTATSPEVRLAVLINCDDGGSAKNILKYDFGTLTELKGANSRTSSSDMAEDYTYQPWAKKINDGYYAVVATPYYCGCGEGSDMGQTVDQCEGNNMWFRDIKDHTLGDKGTAGNYGGMLMINFSDAKSKTAYEHELTSSEKAAFVKGSTLSFSAYFASAAKPEAVDVKINMKLMIQYKAVGTTEWITKAELENKVEYGDNWKYGNTSIDIDDPAGDYRVVIDNYSAAGTGNDALIDDISLDLCVPTFPVSFYDEETDSEYDTYTYKQMDETQIIRIAKQDYGHGDNNCVVLLSVDESKKAGEAGRYELIDVMNLTSYKGADYYSTTKSVNELLGGNVGTGKLQALVTKPEICSDPTKLEDLKTKLYNGDIKPLDSADYMFSTNLLTYNIVCNTTITAAFEGNTSVCEESGKKENDLPKLNVTFGSIASYVYYSISEDGNAVVSDKALSAVEITAGKFSVDLNALDQTKIIRTTGTRKFTVYMYEKASEGSSKICEKTSAAIDLVIKPKPTYTEIPSTVEKCEGFTQNISVSAQNATTYTWQVLKKGSSEWENAEGTNNQATYVIPKTGPETGWKYRVILSNEYCTDVTSNEITLTVNVCDKVLLSINADKTELCKGEEVKFTVAIKNNGTVDVNNMEMTEDVSSMHGLQFVSATQSAGTFASNKWTLSLEAEAQATLELTYKSISDDTVDNTEKVYVSKLGGDTWASYDEQTDASMKGEWAVKSKGVSSTPIITAPYKECAIDGTKQLSDLVSSDKTALEWFENPELTIVVDPATFDMNVPVKDKKYYVVNTEDGKCVSDKAEATVTVKDYATEADITAAGQAVCKGSEVALSASTTTVVPNPIFRWYGDAALTDKLYEGDTYKVTPNAEVTYYVSVENEDYCENKANDGKEVAISLKYPIISVLLQEKDGGEYDLDGVPTVKLNLGMATEKVLTINPTDAPNYSIKWYAGDAEFDGSFPRKPYLDQIYKVVVIDECGNTHIATAGTQVEWPTVFMPYDNSTNKDFVVDIDGGIELLVFDRSGNMVAHTYNGWDGFANQNGNNKIAMPGLYYYKAILPDGSVKKGNVEIFKK